MIIKGFPNAAIVYRFPIIAVLMDSLGKLICFHQAYKQFDSNVEYDKSIMSLNINDKGEKGTE